MKSGGDQEFEAMTMPHVNALFQTALQLTGSLLIDSQGFSYDQTAAILSVSRDEIAQGVALGREHLMNAFQPHSQYTCT
jgi:hypothetical protein